MLSDAGDEDLRDERMGETFLELTGHAQNPLLCDEAAATSKMIKIRVILAAFLLKMLSTDGIRHSALLSIADVSAGKSGRTWKTNSPTPNACSDSTSST